jgi:hypothetical protein
VQTTVIPFLASYFNSFTIYNAVLESKPLVGSSNNSNFGFVISSYPIDVRFLSPPDNPFRKNPPTNVFLQLCNLSLVITFSTIYSIFSAVSLVLSLAANLNSSSGVKVIISTSSYYTKAANFPKSCCSILRPLAIIVPDTEEPLLSLWR